MAALETLQRAAEAAQVSAPTDRIAGAISTEQALEDYQLQGVTRVATGAWGDRRFLEAVHRKMDPWTAQSVLAVRQIPDSDAAWVSFWRDWPVLDAVRAQLAPAVQAAEAYFQAMG